MKRFLLVLILILGIGAISVNAQMKIYLAGDSICAPGNVKTSPYRGWGQIFQLFFKDKTTVVNMAKGGCSTKTFKEKGIWDKLISQVSEGNIVVIQFGHNDWNTQAKDNRNTTLEEYKANLAGMANEVLAAGAQPIFITSIMTRRYDNSGKAVRTKSRIPYVPVMRSLAEEMSIPLIDGELLTEQWLNTMTPDESKKYFLWYSPGDYPAHPEGKKDNVHLNQKGAYEVAVMFAKELCKIKPEIKRACKIKKYAQIEKELGPIKVYRGE